jgi:phosphopantothenate-cysteine ligase/phosphopantothenoylcysteine decarboxylase/phosphopantothenate--cysteine ligase
VHAFRTYEDLRELMAANLTRFEFDCVIHCAAVSDYALDGVYVPAIGTSFNPQCSIWTARSDLPQLEDASAGKVKSQHDELWLRLVPTPKLIDMVGGAWNHRGILVKFKLEVGTSEQELLQVAEASRQQSAAHLIVANTLEGMHAWAYLGTQFGKYAKVERGELALRLMQEVETLYHRHFDQAEAA